MTTRTTDRPLATDRTTSARRATRAPLAVGGAAELLVAGRGKVHA